MAGDHIFIPDLEELGPELGLDLSAYAIARHYEVCEFCKTFELRGHVKLRGLCYVRACGKLNQLIEVYAPCLAEKGKQSDDNCYRFSYPEVFAKLPKMLKHSRPPNPYYTFILESNISEFLYL